MLHYCSNKEHQLWSALTHSITICSSGDKTSIETSPTTPTALLIVTQKYGKVNCFCVVFQFHRPFLKRSWSSLFSHILLSKNKSTADKYIMLYVVCEFSGDDFSFFLTFHIWYLLCLIWVQAGHSWFSLWKSKLKIFFSHLSSLQGVSVSYSNTNK